MIGGNVRPDSFCQCFLAQIIIPFPGGNCQGRLPGVHIQIPGAATDVQQGTNIAIGKAVGAHRILDGLHDLLHSKGHVTDAEYVRRIQQALDMVPQAEDSRSLFRVISPDPFEHRRAVMQCRRKHMHGGFFEFHQFPIHPNIFGFHSHKFFSFFIMESNSLLLEFRAASTSYKYLSISSAI